MFSKKTNKILKCEKFLNPKNIKNIIEPKYNEWAISLRGHKNSPDLSVIAGVFGGGGHAKASGFVIKNSQLRDVFKIKEPVIVLVVETKDGLTKPESVATATKLEQEIKYI